MYSPVQKCSSIRVLHGTMAKHDLELELLDVNATFLYGELEEKIYIEQPDSFVFTGNEDYVCSFKKSLYGIK